MMIILDIAVEKIMLVLQNTTSYVCSQVRFGDQDIENVISGYFYTNDQ